MELVYKVQVAKDSTTGKEFKYNQLYLQLDSKNTIAIKPIYKNDKKIISYIISSNLVKEIK